MYASIVTFHDIYLLCFQFSKEPHYVDECFNRTLVQANADNKKVGQMKTGIFEATKIEYSSTL